jgi:superfamily II DNA or RNA helicase
MAEPTASVGPSGNPSTPGALGTSGTLGTPGTLIPGTAVVVRDERWTIARCEPFEHCTLLTLEGRGPDNAGRCLRAITPFDRVRPSPDAPPLARMRHTVLRAALGAIASERSVLGLWTAADADLELLAYQLEPALAVLRGATRVLLADGVGLGKTIQAGLILGELRARSLVDRALVLCPAGLRQSWATELRDRFGIVATVLDNAAIAVGVRDWPEGINPWAAHPVVIASIDLVKRPDVLAAVEAVSFDLVIADEAHHLTPASDRCHAVNRLGSHAPWLVLVSATPHSGDQSAFECLSAIGSLGEPLVIFRRGRRDIGLPDNRRERLMRVAPTPEETALLRAVDRYAQEIWQARGRSDRAVQLVAVTLARRAASSATAVERTLSRRRALLSVDAPPAAAQGCLPWEEMDDEDGDELDERLARPGLTSMAEERRRLDELIELAHRASASSSKLGRLRRLLTRAREAAVVFTEYRDSLHAVAGSLAPAFRLGTIHGGVPVATRHEVLRQFDRGEVDVLLATDTAGEGLNLHRRCRLVVDLELPWSPLRLEQRIGRVDRLGQRRRVHAVHLLHLDAVEGIVWRHLESRRQRAQDALSRNAPSTEDEMARALFDGIPMPAVDAPIISSVRIDAAEAERARAVNLRRWRGLAPPPGDRAVYARPRTRHRGVTRALAVFERAQLGPGGGLIERQVHARLIALTGVNNLDAWRDAVLEIRRGEVAGSPDPSLLRPMCVAVRSRISAARSRLAAAPQLHQPALFDRRAEHAASARLEVAAQLDLALARRAASLDHEPSASARTRLVAVWPLPVEP